MFEINNKHIVLILIILIFAIFIYNFDIYIIQKNQPLCVPTYVTKREITPEIRAELNNIESEVLKETFNNLCYNINKYLDNNGYLIITTFDGDIVNSLNYVDNKYSSYYTDLNGKNIKFFEIVKKYNDKKLLGSAIDVNISIFRNDNNYVTEYLVYKDFLIK